LLIKYIKSVLWRVAKCLSYIEEARCLKFKDPVRTAQLTLFISVIKINLFMLFRANPLFVLR